jgi:hypothetical protein
MMIQCVDCEFYSVMPDGRRAFQCDPFVNIKEPECLQKWQLFRLDMLVSGFQSMALFQQKMAPMQEKLFKYVKRELDDIEEADSWKFDEDSGEMDDTDDSDNPESSGYGPSGIF